MALENEEKDCIYTVYSGSIEDLTDELIDFCKSRYGDACEFKTVSIHRTHEGGSWELHSFESLKEAVEPMKRHLRARTDSVRIHFGGEDETLQVRVAKGSSSEELARYMKKGDRDNIDQEDIVVLGIDRDGNSIEAAERLFELI